MQQEKYSFWNYLDPFERSGTHFSHACTGLKPSCQLCPSYMPASRVNEPESGIGKLEFKPSILDKVKKKKTHGQWLVPASTDIFAGEDIKDEEIFALIEFFRETPEQTFFFCTKNLYKMSEYWHPIENVYWGISAATQEEVNFQNRIRDYLNPHTSLALKEFLYLAPMTEAIVLPTEFLYKFEYIVVDGYYGEKDLPLSLEWVEAIAEQLEAAKSYSQLIINGLGDRPFYQGEPFASKKRKFCSTTVEGITHCIS